MRFIVRYISNINRTVMRLLYSVMYVVNCVFEMYITVLILQKCLGSPIACVFYTNVFYAVAYCGRQIMVCNNNNNNNLICIAPACRMTSEALADSSSRATERLTEK